MVGESGASELDSFNAVVLIYFPTKKMRRLLSSIKVVTEFILSVATRYNNPELEAALCACSFDFQGPIESAWLWKSPLSSL